MGHRATLNRGKPDINYLKSPNSTYPEELYQKIHVGSSPIHTKTIQAVWVQQHISLLQIEPNYLEKFHSNMANLNIIHTIHHPVDILHRSNHSI